MGNKILWLLVMLLPGSSLAQIDWVDFENNPVIDRNFDPNSQKIWRPSVLFDGQTYHMWYGKDDGNGEEKMGYATSADGKNWTLIDPAVLERSSNSSRFDSNDASQGWVIAENDTFKMWYWGDGPNIGNIGYAWSTDGVNWTKVVGPGTDGSVYDRTMDGGTAFALATPTVVKEGDTYHMWYSRITGLDFAFIGRIAYATSADGINWTNVPGPGTDGAVIDWGDSNSFDGATVLWPAVLKTEAGFTMWYAGATDPQTGGLGYATSPDGVNWTKIPGNGSKGACFDGGHLPSVIKEGDLYKMWYGIFDGSEGDEIHLAFSGTPVSVEDVMGSNIPHNFFLEQNYPNPFNPSTTLKYHLPEASYVSITIYNMTGQKIITLVDDVKQPGIYKIEWDGSNHHGQAVATGLYVIRMVARNFVDSKKIVLLR